MYESFLDGTKVLKNSVGYERAITTLTGIKQKVVEQKFYEIPIADYIPLIVGENSWSSNLLTYVEYSTGEDFESGIINTGANNSRLSEVDTAVDSINVPVVNWAKTIGYTIMDLQIAAKSGNWSLVESKERSRKKNWDLGIQYVAFLGSKVKSDTYGLLTQPDVNSNTAIITEKISGMTAAEFQTFVSTILSAYASNCNYTVMPDRFIMPLDDYLGMGSPVSSDYPMVSKLDYLNKVFKELTANPNFKVLPLSYAQEDINDTAGVSLNRYTLTRYDQDSVKMELPVDYTTTVADSDNSFNWQSVAYGQYTGTKAYRPLETLYYDWGS